MKKLILPDMHCEKCAERISAALGEAGISFEISLKEKAVFIDGCEGCVKKATEILDELGFSAELS